MWMKKKIPQTSVTLSTIDKFYGYSHGNKIGDGEFYDMTNLTSDFYPMLASRRSRQVASCRLTDTGLSRFYDVTFSDIHGCAKNDEESIYFTAKAAFKPLSIGSRELTIDGAHEQGSTVINFTTSGTVAADSIKGRWVYMSSGSYLVTTNTATSITLSTGLTATEADGNTISPSSIADDTSAKLYMMSGTATYADEIGGNDSYMFIPISALCNNYSTIPQIDGRQMIVTGDMLYLFPDKIKVSTRIDMTSSPYQIKWYNLESSVTNTASSTASSIWFMPCDSDGRILSGTVSSTAPTSPAEGAIWVDTTSNPHTFKKYSSNKWAAMSNICTKILVPSPDRTQKWTGISVGDGVEITTTASSLDSQISALNGNHVILKRNWQALTPSTVSESTRFYYIMFEGQIDEAKYISSGTVNAHRKVPDMDYVVEAQNRLWGCKFSASTSDGEGINEIYASKLGDYKNWNAFEGLSTDSYTASIGSRGAFTGAISYNGYPLFFKQDRLHKVYVSSSGAHQIVDKTCVGVKAGCAESLTLVGEYLYYYSPRGIAVTDSSSFNSLPNVFNESFDVVTGGAVSAKYYICTKPKASVESYMLFAYDTEKQLWHKEDAVHAHGFCTRNSKPMMVTNGSNFVFLDSGDEKVAWEAVTGLQGYEVVNRKYISRFNIRTVMPIGSTMDVYIEYNSNGIWEYKGHVAGKGTGTIMLPIRPQRCDHFRIKLRGNGEIKIYSFAKYYEKGSDVT